MVTVISNESIYRMVFPSIRIWLDAITNFGKTLCTYKDKNQLRYKRRLEKCFFVRVYLGNPSDSSSYLSEKTCISCLITKS